METSADTGSVLVEGWETGGTPAGCALRAVLSVLAFQVRKALQATTPQTFDAPTSTAVKTKSRSQTTVPHDSADARFVYLGAAIGILIAYFPCGFLVGYMPEFALFLFAIPLGVVALVACHAWVIHGQLSLPTTLCAVVVSLVNLLAAGGISFAGVSLTLWLLMAISLNMVENEQPARARSRAVLGGLAGLAWLLLLLCHQTAYDPILRSQALLAEANATQQLVEIEDALQRAAAADPYFSEPWLQLAVLHHEQWIRTGNLTTEKAFAEATEQLIKRNPRSNRLQLQLGHWHLISFRNNNRPAHLQDAIEAYRRAESLYPNYNLGCAQSAWVTFLANDLQNASAKAIGAIRLDDLNPHKEQKLAVQAIFDPGPARFPSPQQRRGPEENAELSMLFLRSQFGSNTEPTTSHD